MSIESTPDCKDKSKPWMFSALHGRSRRNSAGTKTHHSDPNFFQGKRETASMLSVDHGAREGGLRWAHGEICRRG